MVSKYPLQSDYEFVLKYSLRTDNLITDCYQNTNLEERVRIELVLKYPLIMKSLIMNELILKWPLRVKSPIINWHKNIRLVWRIRLWIYFNISTWSGELDYELVQNILFECRVWLWNVIKYPLGVKSLNMNWY